MSDALQIEDQFYIVAEAERPPTPLRVLKHGDSFAVFDPHGDILPAEMGEQGLYHNGTRFLSRMELAVCHRRSLLLSSTISQDNVEFTADLTSPDILRDGQIAIARGEIHVFRARALWDGSCVDRVRVSNHALHPIDVLVSFVFDADYADVFEVRGTRRARRGHRLDGAVGQESLLRYVGLDGVERRTRLRWSRVPDRVDSGLASFAVSLDRHASIELYLTITAEVDSESRRASSHAEVVSQSKRRMQARDDYDCITTSSSETFTQWMRRSWADLRMMITDTPHGPYPYAGIPWFSTPFGRDGILTALELLWAAPEVARGVLAFLADTQATAFSDEQDAQPGKILHEMRSGEMAALREVPFGRYYGSADATPLFVMLAHAYFERTADRVFIEQLWPHILAALEWMRTSGDLDGDGFIEYARRSRTGLVQQGWKDSYDSVFHEDGSLAEPPIALCEIQGYAYAAWAGAAQLARDRGDSTLADEWQQHADRLQARFEEAFWCDDLGTYALALDGQKRPCRVRTSNPGHCLFTGIVSPARARRVADTLLDDASFAGWGIRTVASGEARYNPMSYHNGSVWPHDNAIVAAGFARYGMTAAATRVMSAMIDLSSVVDLHRLPELICGFHRRAGESATLYPVACAPQAWAAGAVHLLLASCLGLRIDAVARRVSLCHALLPEKIESLRIANLRVGDASVDLLLTRHPQDVGISVGRRAGDLEIVAIK